MMRWLVGPGAALCGLLMLLWASGAPAGNGAGVLEGLQSDPQVEASATLLGLSAQEGIEELGEALGVDAAPVAGDAYAGHPSCYVDLEGSLGLVAALVVADGNAEELPYYLRDRGTGVTTSQFGTYIEKGELLVYPFYEYEKNTGYEYKGSELGFSNDQIDYLGDSTLHQVLLFVAYAITEDLAVEFEAALYEDAKLERASDDTTSGMPESLHESGFGETEAQIRWRVVHETAARPEVFTYANVDFPLQKSDVLIGNSDWAGEVGLGLVKGFTWGTLTPRIGLAYDPEDSKMELGEWAVEYLKRASDSWRVVATVEGESDEVSLIGEVQWRFSPNAFLKLNCGIGLTEKAPDVAPEVGVMLSF